MFTANISLTCKECDIYIDQLCEGKSKLDMDECPVEIKMQEQSRKKWVR